jgi:hypothetical protein
MNDSLFNSLQLIPLSYDNFKIGMEIHVHDMNDSMIDSFILLHLHSNSCLKYFVGNIFLSFASSLYTVLICHEHVVHFDATSTIGYIIPIPPLSSS